MPCCPEALGGSADLTGSNNTKTKDQAPLTRDNYGGRYVYYGIREFGMAAAMNGMALHGGVIPYGGTFLVFADYCRPAIRLSALQRARVVYVMTHDSIGLGEDGPTHQPIEHLMALRVIPGLDVYRPADAIETTECWDLALKLATARRVLALTRQNLAQLRDGRRAENRSARGAYRLRAATAPRRVILTASGSEVEIAVAVREGLEAAGVGADVVSMPCWERFDAQPHPIAPTCCPMFRPTVKSCVSRSRPERRSAGSATPWCTDCASASTSSAPRRPRPALYDHFGLTAAKITPRVLWAANRQGKRRHSMAKVAINGFGRIGRLVARAILAKPESGLELVSINDLADAKANARLFKRDSVHGAYPGTVEVDGNDLIIDGKRIHVTAERDPANLPHAANGIDIALECTGFFTDRDSARKHLTAGAKRVLISAPAKGVDLTVVYGVNHDKLTGDHIIVSNASCTTNCLAPFAKVLHESIGIERGLMTTIHAYTNDQKILDQIHPDLRRARAAGMSMIPTTTGAARAVGEVLPELKGKLDGSAIRVPVPDVSLIDLTFTPKRDTNVEEVNGLLKAASDRPAQGHPAVQQRAAGLDRL